MNYSLTHGWADVFCSPPTMCRALPWHNCLCRTSTHLCAHASAYVYVHACTRLCTCMPTFTHMSAHAHTHVYTRLHTRLHAFMPPSAHVYTNVCTSARPYLHKYINRPTCHRPQSLSHAARLVLSIHHFSIDTTF